MTALDIAAALEAYRIAAIADDRAGTKRGASIYEVRAAVVTLQEARAALLDAIVNAAPALVEEAERLRGGVAAWQAATYPGAPAAPADDLVASIDERVALRGEAVRLRWIAWILMWQVIGATASEDYTLRLAVGQLERPQRNVCAHCQEEHPLIDGQMGHVRECPRNPMVAEVARLRGLVERAVDIADHWIAVANVNRRAIGLAAHDVSLDEIRAALADAATAPPLTVGAALALPEVQDGRAVIEYSGTHDRAVARQTRIDRYTIESRWFRDGQWSPWRSRPEQALDGCDARQAARLVRAGDADADLATRGPL